MDFELWWLLVIIPVVFAFGWGASRLDLRQWRREQMDAPRAYFKGLHFLLNEQQDKAIDAFIEAVQYDANTADLHFALGNLFRRRGEYERAVRVHQHLLARADLPASERDRAQYALAQDYLKAGLMDHAEKALLVLKDVPTYQIDVNDSLLTLYERAHDWSLAISTVEAMEKQGVDNLLSKKSHYYCELAAEAGRKGDDSKVLESLETAYRVSPKSPRPSLDLAYYHLQHEHIEEALQSCAELLAITPRFLVLIVPSLTDFLQKFQEKTASETGQEVCTQWRKKIVILLEDAYQQEPSLGLLMAFLKLEGNAEKSHSRIMSYLQKNPSIIASSALLGMAELREKDNGLHEEIKLVHQTLERAAKQLDRYRCSFCGFEAVRYFWQCPGCQSWDSYPPKRVEEL
ncbi:MAG: lipopolysaccharide assembly protein LapB [Saezia sp.]